MFDLVADIEAYPSFLPWCQRATILELQPDLRPDLQPGAGPRGDVSYVRAELWVGFRLLAERFESHVHLDRTSGTIRTQQAGGVLKELWALWEFAELAAPGSDSGADSGATSSGGERPAPGEECSPKARDASQVKFRVRFAFHSFLLQRAVQSVFLEAQKKMISAFLQEAHKRYGKQV